MTELQVLTNVFYILERDSDMWTSTAGSEDSEYLTARGFLNLGVGRWEKYENTTWRELWTDLTTASSGNKTVSSAVFTYDCPTDFVRPGGYVTTTDSAGGVTFWNVIPSEKVGERASDTSNFVYFIGNKSAGFDLKFNPNSTPTAGGTINYPYYKGATTSSATSTVLEMSDPNFLTYFVAAHMSESSDNIDGNFFQISEGLLNQMKSFNNSGIWGVPNNINSSLEDLDGFGNGGNVRIDSSNPTGR